MEINSSELQGGFVLIAINIGHLNYSNACSKINFPITLENRVLGHEL